MRRDERDVYRPDEASGQAASKFSSHLMGRREFLKLASAGAGVAALFGISGATSAKAQESSGVASGGSGTLGTEFEGAAKEYGLPVGILLAMGYVNTRWEMPDPESNQYEKGDLHGWGSYGIMGLVQNPTADTLGAASRLTGISEEDLKKDRAANIRGGAALLAEALGGKKPQDPSGCLEAVSGRGKAPGKNFSAVSGVGGGEIYADQLRETLEKGVEAKTNAGEKLSLPAHAGSGSGGGR